MGWLWAGSKVAKPSAKKDDSPMATFAEEANTLPPPESPAPATSITPNQSSSDLDSFFREFQAPASSSSSSSSSSQQASYSSSSLSSHFEDSLSSPQTWKPSILHPSTMSCTHAFDQAMYCQILGGQIANYYRFGSMRNCGELWSNFWFCMRTNRGFMSDEEREKRIQAFYIAREARLKKEGSSEDVWEAREEENIRPWAREQFRWDLIRYEKGEAIWRERSD